MSFGQLKEQLGLDKTTAALFLHAIERLGRNCTRSRTKRTRSETAEKPLDRLQSEVMSVSERLALFAHVMDGSAFLLVPRRKK